MRDNGRGFDAAAVDGAGTSFGLQIMRERAAGIGAEVRLASTPGRGTEVLLTLPQ